MHELGKKSGIYVVILGKDVILLIPIWIAWQNPMLILKVPFVQMKTGKLETVSTTKQPTSSLDIEGMHPSS